MQALILAVLVGVLGSIFGISCLFVVSSQLGQLLELRHIFVQLSSLHLELEELLFGPFSAHDVLEVLGKVIDHSFPDPFIGVSYSRSQMAVQLCGYFLDPKVHFWSPKVTKEQHCSGHRIVHDPCLFVDPLVDAPAGHEFFHFVPISCEDLRFFADHLVR